MPLVNYEGDSSDEDDNNNDDNQPKIDLKPSTSRRLHLPTPAQTSSKITIEDDDDEISAQHDNESSSGLLANLPKPLDNSSSTINTNSTDIVEDELEDIVRGDNKEYAKNIPQLPKPIKRKRDGPVKIFIPTIEQDSDDEDKPKRRPTAPKGTCALLNSLPAPMHDDEKPTPSLPAVKNPSTTSPQISSTGLFIPYTLNKKQQQQKKASTAISTSSNNTTKNNSDIEDDDEDDNQADFLGLTKSNRIEVTNIDVESVLRETFPKARPTVIEQPTLPNPSADFVDLDNDQEEEQANNQQIMQDDDELLKYLPKSERYKEIKHVHIDSMLSESAKLQLLKNATEERETMVAQAAIHVPKGEVKKRAQITYLIAKAQHDDLQLKNMWSEQKLTKRQTQAKYGF